MALGLLREGCTCRADASTSQARRQSLRPVVARLDASAFCSSSSSSSSEPTSSRGRLQLAGCPVPRSRACALPRRSRCVLRAANAGDTEATLQDLPPLLFTDPSQAPTLDQLPEQLAELSPKQLADAIWGFAKQGLQPATELMDAIAAEVQTKLEHFRSQDLSNTIWALAVLKYQPSQQWWAAFERQVYTNLTDFTDRELANLMWSLAVLEHRPTWVLGPLLSGAADSFPAYSANALHLVGWACGKLGYCPSGEWLDAYLRSAQAAFFQLTPSEMSNLIWALAKLGHKLPAKWLDSFLMVAQWRFPSFSAKTLSVVAWAVASLGHTPSQEWLLGFEQQVRENFQRFSGQELACIAWALRRFGYSAEHNAVFYMLQRQDRFLDVDFEILGNSKLLGQVMAWQKEGGFGGPLRGGPDGGGSGAGAGGEDGSCN